MKCESKLDFRESQSCEDEQHRDCSGMTEPPMEWCACQCHEGYIDSVNVKREPR
jgi:hypothetical protein